MRAFIGRVLRRRYRVTETASATEALAELEARRFDAVVSDVMMPGIDGYELCRRVKVAPATAGVPVILITARHQTSFALAGFHSGADDYVIKPFSADELLARVDVHVRLRRLLDEWIQREKLATLGTVAAGLAHEVRNPLSAILAGLRRVQRDLDGAAVPPKAVHMIGVALDCAQRIDRLVGDVLTLGHPDQQGPEWVDLHEGLESALRLLSHRTPANVEVRRRFAYEGQVLAEPASLNQVFVNLLDNALRAVGDRGAIEVATRSNGGGVVVTVADSGPGVPPAVAGRIFDPFFTTRPVGEGTGLGLHLSRRIVYNHGGTLELVSAPGWGACFEVRLPAPGHT
jgi:signal transduction histidine kinase